MSQVDLEEINEELEEDAQKDRFLSFSSGKRVFWYLNAVCD